MTFTKLLGAMSLSALIATGATAATINGIDEGGVFTTTISASAGGIPTSGPADQLFLTFDWTRTPAAGYIDFTLEGIGSLFLSSYAFFGANNSLSDVTGITLDLLNAPAGAAQAVCRTTPTSVRPLLALSQAIAI